MLTEERLYKMMEPFDLLFVKHQNESRQEIHFRRRRLPTGRRNLLSKVGRLQNGTLTGYIYVGHLPEFHRHPSTTKSGYFPINKLKEDQFKQILSKVTEHYR